MALIAKNRVIETSTTTGTGNQALGGAVDTNRTFASVCATNDTFEYYVKGAPGTGEWEVGLGTYPSANTLARTTVLDSSNAGAAVSFSAGTKQIGMGPIASFGAAFPSAVYTGQRFYRTDRNIEYFYDGTRWLSTQLFTLVFPTRQAGSVAPSVAGSSSFAVKPWASYDIYVLDGEIASYSTTTTASNYFTYQFKSYDGATIADLGSSTTGQNDTQNAFVRHTITINTLVSSSIEAFEFSQSSTGVVSVTIVADVTYRLVG